MSNRVHWIELAEERLLAELKTAEPWEDQPRDGDGQFTKSPSRMGPAAKKSADPGGGDDDFSRKTPEKPRREMPKWEPKGEPGKGKGPRKGKEPKSRRAKKAKGDAGKVLGPKLKRDYPVEEDEDGNPTIGHGDYPDSRTKIRGEGEGGIISALGSVASSLFDKILSGTEKVSDKLITAFTDLTNTIGNWR